MQTEETTAAPPDNLRDTILELAGKDREATLHNVYAALEELGAIRMLTAAIAYDHRIVGAHREARHKIIAAMGEALESSEVIGMNRFTQITGASELHAVLAVVLPANAKVPEPQAKAEIQEKSN